MTGTCNCTQSAEQGFFADLACSTCLLGYSGPQCTLPCPMSGGTVCSSQGRCVNGLCFCNTGFCGASCELVRNEANCPSCGAVGLYGPMCALSCPGGSISEPCSGHGSCGYGRQGNGKCICDSGYGLNTCSTPCPAAEGVACGGHGVCSSETATCACDRFYGGPACTQRCAEGDGLLCSGKGHCDEGSSNSGSCICRYGYSGASCNVTCPLTAAGACNSRGICSPNGQCICSADYYQGYWQGEDCSRCLEPYGGPDCRQTCGTTVVGTVCSGHGICSMVTGVCACVQDTASGYWDGPLCETCKSGYFGAKCQSECPGGACSPCSNHGTCSDGVNGTGLCSCFSNSSHGYWTLSNCTNCVSGFFGEHCRTMCPIIRGTICWNGVCDDGIAGSGECRCRVGFQPDAVSGLCTSCASGYYGRSCLKCPSATEQPCSGRGVCDDGITGTGNCLCAAGFAGSNCSMLCPVADGVTCGRGQCVSNNTCGCETGFELNKQGTCTTCMFGLFGTNCDQVCPDCAYGNCTQTGSCSCQPGYWGALCDTQCPGGASNPCSGHGTCDTLTGICTCTYSSQGYYIGASCERCDANYLSTHCTLRCPAFNGVICSGRGTCFNGQCLDCRPLSNETSTTTLRCGFACQWTDQQCITTGCPTGYFGSPACTSLCPGATLVNPSLACSQHGLCNASGTCTCALGYFGPSCNRTCPSTASGVLCGGRGSCSDGYCVCSSGSYGPSCEFECPGGVSNPCNGHGVCSSAGLCDCTSGYFGDSCNTLCPGGAGTPCSLNGICTVTGSCQCFYNSTYGYFGGALCQRCADQVSGSKCMSPCPASRGIVVGRTCLCREGYVGDGCLLSCPVDATGQPCSGRGSCVVVRVNSSFSYPKCSCAAGYYGTICSVQCTAAECQKQGFYRASCNSETGACACKSDSAGYWAGPKCDKCQGSYWGPECNTPCPCNGNGACDVYTGTCSCYANAVDGYWTGTLCDTCSPGYAGLTCTYRSVSLPPLSQTATSKIVPTSPAVVASFADDLLNVTLVQNGVNRSLVNIGRLSLQTGKMTVLGTLNLTVAGSGSEVDRFMAINKTTIRVTFTNKNVTFLPRDAATLLSANYTPGARSFVVAAVSSLHSMRTASTTVGPVPVGTFKVGAEMLVLGWYGSTETLLCSVFVVGDLEDDKDAFFGCNETSVSGGFQWAAMPQARVNITGSSEVFKTILWTGLTADAKRLVLVGDSRLDYGNWAWMSVDIATGTIGIVGRNPSTKARGTPIQCFEVVDLVVDCLFFDGVRSVVLMAAFDVVATASAPAVLSFTLLSSTNLGAKVTAVARDPQYALGILAFNIINQPSSVLLFTLDSKMDLIGSFSFNGMVTSALLDGSMRFLTVYYETDFVSVRQTLNLFGIQSVSPPVIDGHGGQVVTITGVGFPTDAPSAWCNVSHTILPATIESSNKITCRTSASLNPDSSACTLELLNVAFGGQYGNRQTDSTTGLYRPGPATLQKAVTAVGNEGFGAFDTPTSITITGFGFVSTSFGKCRLVNLTSISEDEPPQVIFESASTFINSTTIVCSQPLAPASAVPTGLEYSHDGYYYGRGSNAPYIVVGPSTGLVAETVSNIIVADLYAVIPRISVFLTDAFFNRRYNLESTPFFLRCTSILPILQVAGIAETQQFASDHNQVVYSVAGVAVLSNVTLVKPQSGVYTFYLFYPTNPAMQTTLTFTIVPGEPVEIAVTKRLAWVAGVIAPRKIQPSPVMTLIDRAGNVAIGNESFARVIFSSNNEDENGNPIPSTSTMFALIDSDGSFTFDGISMRTSFDNDAFMTFSVGTVPQLRIVIPQEKCMDGVEYAVSGTFRCRACPPYGVCDGTSDVKLTAGFWRSNAQSYVFYACAAFDACPGLGPCNGGYSGILCGTCAEGYGKSGTTCEVCYSNVMNYAVIAALVLVIIAVVVYLSLMTVPLTCTDDIELYVLNKKEPNPLSIVVKITVSHLQMLSLIPYRNLVVPSWMSSFLKGSESASRFNPNLSFLGCTFFGDTDESQMRTVILLLPGIVALFVVICFAIAYRRTYKATDRDKLRATIMQEHSTVGKALHRSVHKSLAINVALDSNHFDTLMKDHQELIVSDGEEEDDLVDRNEREERDRLKRLVEFKERFFNMFLLSTLVTAFFLYPTLINACAKMLDCRTIDFGPLPSRRVLSSDPSVDCSSASYQQSLRIAYSCIIGLGVGIPLLNFLLVKIARFLTCHGDIYFAKTIFFFSTGGYRHNLWYWESVSLLRKLCLVLAVTLLPESFSKLLAAQWTLMVAVMLNITMRPWQERYLSTAETISLGSIALSFAFVELLSFGVIAESDAYILTTYICIAIVNIVALAVLVLAGMFSLRKTVTQLAAKKGRVGYFFKQVQGMITDVADTADALEITAADLQTRLAHEHQRLFNIAFIEMFADKANDELRNAAHPAADSKDAATMRLNSENALTRKARRKRLPKAKTFTHAVDMLEQMKDVIKTRAGRSMILSRSSRRAGSDGGGGSEGNDELAPKIARTQSITHLGRADSLPASKSNDVTIEDFTPTIPDLHPIPNNRKLPAFHPIPSHPQSRNTHINNSVVDDGIISIRSDSRRNPLTPPVSMGLIELTVDHSQHPALSSQQQMFSWTGDSDEQLPQGKINNNSNSLPQRRKRQNSMTNMPLVDHEAPLYDFAPAPRLEMSRGKKLNGSRNGSTMTFGLDDTSGDQKPAKDELRSMLDEQLAVVYQLQSFIAMRLRHDPTSDEEAAYASALLTELYVAEIELVRIANELFDSMLADHRLVGVT